MHGNLREKPTSFDQKGRGLVAKGPAIVVAARSAPSIFDQTQTAFHAPR